MEKYFLYFIILLSISFICSLLFTSINTILSIKSFKNQAKQTEFSKRHIDLAKSQFEDMRMIRNVVQSMITDLTTLKYLSNKVHLEIKDSTGDIYVVTTNKKYKLNLQDEEINNATC